jgi:nascent polypeptide-associated complex subunit alpha
MIPGLPGGGNPRQMAMMMKKLGIDVRDIEDVSEVVVRTPQRDYVFAKAAVSVMTAQGVETWQISGKPRVVERGASSAGPAAALASAVPPAPPVRVQVSEDDVALVAKETGATPDAARQALVDCNGDLAEAILKLTT